MTEEDYDIQHHKKIVRVFLYFNEPLTTWDTSDCTKKLRQSQLW
jgi:hypothetical protein